VLETLELALESQQRRPQDSGNGLVVSELLARACDLFINEPRLILDTPSAF